MTDNTQTPDLTITHGGKVPQCPETGTKFTLDLSLFNSGPSVLTYVVIWVGDRLSIETNS